MRYFSGIVFMATALACGCRDSNQIESDHIGPRTTQFKAGVSFVVCIIEDSPGPLTIERSSPFAPNETLFLLQPPILTNPDVRAISIEEPPGQWASLTVQLHQQAAEKYSAALTHEDHQFAILIDDKIVAIQKPSEVESSSAVTVRESFSVPDIRSAVE